MATPLRSTSALRSVVQGAAGATAALATPPAPAAGEPPPDRVALYGRIRDTLAGPGVHDEEIQYELACWVELLETSKEDLRDDGRSKDEIIERLVREAGAAVAALLSEQPELVFARALRVETENELLRHNGLVKRTLIRLTDGSPLLTVCLGAFGALGLGLATHLAWYALQGLGPVKALVPFDQAQGSAVASAAFLGGLVSILSRLKSFSRLGDFDHVFLFTNALFKPFIGVIFGLFAYAFWLSGLLPLDPKLIANVTAHQLWVVGFLAGFSERFTQDLISRGEGILPAQKKA
ncbi:MAG TPA: hypothetical protein VHQ91_05610 [Geminicoccaceae bacterium]|jgi:hypothetical protein|nr:hypothetical protein [Geminicoccaceae bacterium]